MNVPKLRFKGFKGEWKKKKLREVADIIGGGTPKTTVPEYWDGEIDWYSPSEIGNQIYLNHSKRKITELGLQKSSARMLPVGTILFTSRAGIGNTAILAKEATTNQGFQSIVPNKNKLDTYFIYSRSHELKRYGEINGAGSTFIEVSGKQMEQMLISLPEIKEQQKIGLFFEKLDRKIQLQQEKIDLLQKQKKGFLQKMFPKAGESQPELRFDEFKGDWKQYRLGEVSEIIGGGTPNTKKAEYWNGNISWYSPTEIGENIYLHESQKKITELGLQKSSARILPIGTVLFTSRAGIGNTAILTEEGCTNQGFQSIVPNPNKLDTYFIFSRTAELKRYGEKNGAGSTFIEISGKQMSRMPILLPSIKEQRKVGLFFKRLDDRLTLEKRKLKGYQKQKQAFLQQMFI